MKDKKKIWIAGISLIILMIALFLIYRIFIPKAQAGTKQIQVTVIHGDKTSKEFNYQTDEDYLGAVLVNENLISGEDGPYGLFITMADGEAADATKQQWWCITKDGEQVNTAADTTPINDKDAYELTLMEGY